MVVKKKTPIKKKKPKSICWSHDYFGEKACEKCEFKKKCKK